MKHLISALILLGGMTTPALATVIRTDYFCPPYHHLEYKLPLGSKYKKCVKLALFKVTNVDSTDTITYTINGRTRYLRPRSGSYLGIQQHSKMVTVTIDNTVTVQVNPRTHNLSFWRYNYNGQIGYRLVPRNTNLIEK